MSGDKGDGGIGRRMSGSDGGWRKRERLGMVKETSSEVTPTHAQLNVSPGCNYNLRSTTITS